MPKTVISANYTVVEATITRPDNTTQYAAGDVIADTTGTASAITFSSAARQANASGRITQATIIDSANQATKPTLKLYLFDTEPTSDADNDAWAPTDAEMANIIGYVTFAQGSWEVGGSTAGTAGNCAQSVSASIPFKAGAGSADLYGILVERGTYTPVAEEEFTIRLGVEQGA